METTLQYLVLWWEFKPWKLRQTSASLDSVFCEDMPYFESLSSIKNESLCRWWDFEPCMCVCVVCVCVCKDSCPISDAEAVLAGHVCLCSGLSPRIDEAGSPTLFRKVS